MAYQFRAVQITSLLIFMVFMQTNGMNIMSMVDGVEVNVNEFIEVQNFN